VAYTVDGQCQATARGAIAISGITRPFDVPDAFFADAARALLDQRIERVVVMPVVTGAGIASDDIGQQMQRELASAIRRTLETERRWRPGDDRSVQVAPYGEGMPVQGAWQARLLLDRSRLGIEARVEFRGPGDASIERAGWFAPHVLPPSSGPPILRVQAAKLRFRAGDLLDVRVQVLRPSRLFCFIMASDGRASLLYPTWKTQQLRGNLFAPSDAEMRFPAQFFSPVPEIRLPAGVHEFFHCIATPRPPPEELMALWLGNSVEALGNSGAGRNSVSVEMTRQILSVLRREQDRAETFAEIVSE